MSKSSLPISKIKAGTTKGYRIRPRVLNLETGKKQQICIESKSWTRAEAEAICKKIIDLGPAYFQSEFCKKKEPKVEKKSDNVTLDEAFEEYMKLNPRGNKVTYMNLNREYYHCYVSPEYGRKNIFDLDDSDIYRWRNSLSLCVVKKDGKFCKKGNPLKNRTKNRILIVMKDLISHINKQYKTKLDSAIGSFDTKCDGDTVIPTWNLEEVNKLLSVIGPNNYRDLAFLSLLALSGIRRGECRSIHESNINFATSTLTISNSIGRIKGKRFIEGSTKNGKTREVRLTPSTKYLLEKQLEQIRKTHGYDANKSFVFGGLEPLSEKECDRLFNKYKALAKAKYPDFNTAPTTHSLRHTFSTYVTQETSLHNASKILNHSSVAVTQGYVVQEKDDSCLDVMDAVIHHGIIPNETKIKENAQIEYFI